MHDVERPGRSANWRSGTANALEEKDRQACEAFAAKYGAPNLACRPKPFDASDRRKNAIAFSLWGPIPIISTARCRTPFWRSTSIPSGCAAFTSTRAFPRASSTGWWATAQVVQFREPVQGNYGLFWRFFVANDPTVNRFLCRDCDCRLNAKERVAVEEWIASGQCFHIMRDHLVHSELILAGMWGGVTGVLPDIKQKSETYFRSYGERWVDQHFLREEIWPLIKDRSLTHDAYYALGNSRPFPQFGTLPRPLHVGGSTPRAAKSPK